MSERNRIVHIWLEFKDNIYEPSEYAGSYNNDLAEKGIASSTFENSFIFSYSKYWSKKAIERAKGFKIKPEDLSYVFLIFDKDYKNDNLVGIMQKYPTVFYLGWFEFVLPSLPKLKVANSSVKVPEGIAINFFGKEFEKDVYYVRLAYEPVKSLSEFQIFPKIKNIHLIQQNMDIQIDKIEDMSLFPQLETLFLFGNKISKLENLTPLINLKRLAIHNALIERIENLSTLLFLIELKLSGNKISKIDGLENLLNLKKLDLSENKIEKIENLYSLSSIYELKLHNNYIRVIENLSSLLSVQKIDLSSNLIAKITDIEDLPNLKVINLYNNQIKELKNLNHPSLMKLMLGFNQIQKIENLSGLKMLSWLDLNHNEFEKIENLENLHNLEHLDISENKITRLENLENLTSLKDLSVWGNPIKEIAQTTYDFLMKNHNIKLGMVEMENIGVKRFIDKNNIEIVS